MRRDSPEALPVPRQAGGQVVEADVFDAFHQGDQRIPVFLATGREADAAIADHRRRHPVPGCRVEPRLPSDMSIEMGVQVKEARGDDLARGVDLLAARTSDLADRGDAGTGDGDIGLEGRATGSVNHEAVADHEIELLSHGLFHRVRGIEVRFQRRCSGICSRPQALAGRRHSRWTERPSGFVCSGTLNSSRSSTIRASRTCGV